MFFCLGAAIGESYGHPTQAVVELGALNGILGEHTFLLSIQEHLVEHL